MKQSRVFGACARGARAASAPAMPTGAPSELSRGAPRGTSVVIPLCAALASCSDCGNSWHASNHRPSLSFNLLSSSLSRSGHVMLLLPPLAFQAPCPPPPLGPCPFFLMAQGFNWIVISTAHLSLDLSSASQQKAGRGNLYVHVTSAPPYRVA